jgi:LDH2 family malate/lactate/ureidoglycolate dehydrogenase
MKIKIDILKGAAVEILKACGESEEGASLVADAMVKADARGITTHGTYLLSPIYDRTQAKMLALPTKVAFVKDEKAVALVDGGDGLGAIAGKAAVDAAIKKAKEFGVGTALIRNTNNVGSLAYYTEIAAKEGMIALMGCNAASALSPWGGAEAFMGTNPMALAIWTGGDVMFSADLASSVVARGKIRKAARNGESIPADWAMDAEGNATTDPNAALMGCLLPMGGPKGSAIALFIDIISGVLSGSAYAQNLKSFHTLDGSTGVGASIIVINIESFMPLERFKELMAGYIASMKGIKKAKGNDEIYLPGERSQTKEKKSIAEGVSLDDNAVKALNDLLEKIGSETRLS